MPVILVRHGDSQYNAARFPVKHFFCPQYLTCFSKAQTGNRDPLIIDPLLVDKKSETILNALWISQGDTPENKIFGPR